MTCILGNSASVVVFQAAAKAFSLQGLMEGRHSTDGLFHVHLHPLPIGLGEASLNEKDLPPAPPGLATRPQSMLH